MIKRLIMLVFAISILSGCSISKIDTEIIDMPDFATMQKEYIIPESVNSGVNIKDTGLYTALDDYNRLYPFSYYMYSGKLLECYKTIYYGFYRFDNTINVSQYGVSKKAVKDMITYMLYDNPDFYYVDTNLSMSVRQTEEELVDIIKVKYKYPKEQVELWGRKVQEVADMLRSDIEKLPLYDKYLYIHDFIVANVRCNESYDGMYDNNIIGSLIERKATCQGYTTGFNYLCRSMGLMSTVATGYSEGTAHIWSCVPLGEIWAYIDTTYDDSPKNDEAIKHSYFGIDGETYYAKSKIRGTLTDEAGFYPRLKTSDKYYYLNVANNVFQFTDLKDTALTYTELYEVVEKAKESGYYQIALKTKTLADLKYLHNTILSADSKDMHSVFFKNGIKAISMDTDDSVFVLYLMMII